MSGQQPHVVIIGAGVIGLTAAVFLVESGYAVTVIAAHVPGDEDIEYTSPWAGAHWRTHATAHEPELCKWDMETFRYWSELMSQPPDPSLPSPCLKMQTSYHLYDTPRLPSTAEQWWTTQVPGYTELSVTTDPTVQAIRAAIPTDQHRPTTLTAAARSQAMSVDAPQYLTYLAARAARGGAVIFRSRLPTDGGLGKALDAAEGIWAAIHRGRVSPQPEREGSRGGVDVFVHAAGLGARALCGDAAVFPVKGQTVRVRGEAAAIRTWTADGFQAYCIPRPGSGTTILGGTKAVGDGSAGTSEAVTGRILETCGFMVPELRTGRDGGFEVMSVQCGHRPAREGGPRVEKEVVGGRKVVHAYGHAGAGYQNSIGSTRATVRLVEEFLGRGGGAGAAAKL